MRQRDTKGYKGIQGETRGYKGIQCYGACIPFSPYPLSDLVQYFFIITIIIVKQFAKDNVNNWHHARTIHTGFMAYF